MGEVDDAGDAVGEPVRDIVGDGELLRVKDGVHDTLGDEDSEEDAAALTETLADDVLLGQAPSRPATANVHTERMAEFIWSAT